MIESITMEKRPFQNLINSRRLVWLVAWGIADLFLLIGAAGYIFQTRAVLDSQPKPVLYQPAPRSSLPSRLITADNPPVTDQPNKPLTLTPSPELSPDPLEIVTLPESSSSPPKALDNQILIGYTLGGRPLIVTQFGKGKIERMIVAGIHGGNEYNTILLAEKLIRYLSERPQKIPKDITLYILPALNPDGEARAHNIYGRANQNGVDLNHNFPIGWKAHWSPTGCWNYLELNGGNRPASEPETIALMGFLLSHRVDALISYHSAALGIFAGGDPPDPASQRLAEQVAAVSDYPYPPINTGCEMTGSLADWAVSQKIAALDVELTNHTDIDFQQNLKILKALLDWRR